MPTMAELWAGGTNHFRQRHLSNPPGNGRSPVSQIIGVTRATFMGGSPGNDVWLTCTVQDWTWTNNKWVRVPGTHSLRVHLEGTWIAGPGSTDTHPIGQFTNFGFPSA